VSAYRRNGTGPWVSKFQLDGRQCWTPGGPWGTKRQAQEAERRHRDQLEARRTQETCASFAERWLEDWPRTAASTRKLYAQAATRFTEQFGATPLGEVERISARSWALGIPRNISKIVGTMYEDARNVGLVEENPFSNLRLPETERTRPVLPPSLDEFRALLGACIVHGAYAGEFRALIQFTAWTGIRASEVQGLQLPDVGHDTVSIRRARKDDGSYGKPKNGKERLIAFPEPARVLDQVPRREGSPFVFHTPRGVPLKKGNLYYLWNKVRDTSGTSMDRIADGLSPIRFHDLRHFCATRLLELGLDHFAVSVQLGHEDGGALVMARYGHPSKDAARERLLARFGPEPGVTGSRGGSQIQATPRE
jgi:integrase